MIMCFCMSGSSSYGISTPRSPRPIMMPSLTSSMSARLFTPARFSIFDMMSMSEGAPISARYSRTSTMSCALDTNEQAIKSTSCSLPYARSLLSCADRYGILNSLSGKNMDLRSETSPPTSTRHITSGTLTSVTSKIISPLLSSMRSPGCISSHTPLYDTDTRFSLPTTSSVVNAKVSPSASVILPFSNVPMRNSGPFVSSMTASGMSSFSRTFFTAAIFFACSSCEPCDALMRATFMPAFAIAEITFSVSDAGPRVQMILVFFMSHLRCYYLSSFSPIYCTIKQRKIASVLAVRSARA